MNQQTHFFFAVKIPKETKMLLNSHIEKLKKELPFSRWVHHEDLHITLAFLGGASKEKLEDAINTVKHALKDEPSFLLKINKLGFFGSNETPRVFWADTEESSSLQAIRAKVFSACERAGFELETRPFRPHITLARKWNGTDSFQQEFLKIWSQLQPEPLEFLASDVVLYQTHLQKTPKYEPIIVFPLK